MKLFNRASNLRLITPISALILVAAQPLNAYTTPNQQAITLHKLIKSPKLETQFLAAAAKHKLDPVLLASIAMLESGLNNSAVNAKTNDHCMLQVNAKTAKSLKLDIKKLTTSSKYCINAGAKILSWFKRTYQVKEPHTWTCRFNVGTRNRVPQRACLAYLKKLDNIQKLVKLKALRS